MAIPPKRIMIAMIGPHIPNASPRKTHKAMNSNNPINLSNFILK